MPGWLYDGLAEWLAEKVTGLLGGLLAMLTTSVFTSPDVTVFPQVQQLAGRSLMVVNAVYVLAVIAAALLHLVSGSVQAQFQAKDLAPRLVAGLVAANFGADVCRLLIEVANAAMTALAGPAASGPQVVRFVQDRIAIAMTDASTAVLAAVVGVLIVVLFCQLLFGWLARVAVLIVLAGLAPVALACHGLPQTQPIAVLWWRGLAGALVAPVLQATFFATTVALLLGPSGTAPELLGIGAGAAREVVNLFTALCLLMLTVRIPRLIARHVTQARPAGTGAVMVRALLLQAVTRRIGLR